MKMNRNISVGICPSPAGTLAGYAAQSRVNVSETAHETGYTKKRPIAIEPIPVTTMHCEERRI